MNGALASRKMRIVFIASEPLGWQVLESLYNACLENSRLEPVILNVGFRGWLNLADDCSKILGSRKIDFIDGSSRPINVEDLNADAFVLSDPYDQFRDKSYSVARLAGIASVIYIPYGADFSGRTGPLQSQLFGNDTVKKAWRIFTRSPFTVNQYASFGVTPSAIVPLGLPLFENYFTYDDYSFLPEEFKVRKPGRLRLIYSPHHSLEGWSTFMQNKDVLKDWVSNHDCQLLFRPHPGLGPTLAEGRLMTAQQFRSFFNMRNCVYHSDPNYYPVFHWADALITDASSFLVEFAPTKRPVIYTEKQGGWDIDDSIKPYVVNGYYRASNPKQLIDYLNMLVQQQDPLKEQRIICQRLMSKSIFDGGAGARISKYIADHLPIGR